MVRRTRNALHSGLTPESLGHALNAFESGDLRRGAQIFDTISRRDNVIATVKPKREKAVARRDWQILTLDDSLSAKTQQRILEDFWNNVVSYDSLNRNDRGGLAHLIRRMMQAQSYMFSVHHLMWQPTRERLICTFESVPLWFFENRTGELRFCPTGMEYTGQDMQPEEWLVTTGDGLMIAGSIGAVAKRNTLVDWMVFSEKFGVPGILGKTSQAEDSAGGIAMQTAVETFSSDWAAVLFGDDTSGSIELIEAKGASNLPMPALIDLIDRRLAALWRGADLSSMSSSSGEGTGASLQREEMDLIEMDDALSISEKLNEIERTVLQWHFGRSVKPLAYLRISTPQRDDLKLLLEAVTKLVELGAPIAISEVLERFGLPQTKPTDDLLGKPKETAQNPAEEQDAETQLNADRAEEVFLARAARLLAAANADDRADLVDELKDVLRADDSTILNATTSFLSRLPDRVGKDAHQVTAWETLLTSALVNGLGKGTPQNQAA
jgi:phage gp29-like protein